MQDTGVTDERPSVSAGWIASFGLLYFGLNVAWAAPSQLLIANQVLAWFPEDKEVRLGWLMGAGGLLSLIGSPVAGWLSDRTRTRFGRRTPWIVGGALAASGSLVVAGFADGYWTLLVAWLVFQLTLAAAMTTSQTVPPDRVPKRQFGVISGVMGLTYTIAVVGGAFIGDLFSIPVAYLVTAAMTLGFLFPFLLAYPERAAENGEAEPIAKAPATSLSDMFTPNYRDFWWTWVARLLVTLAQALALFYLLYYLRDRIQLADPDTGVVILSLIYAVCVVLTGVSSGWLSDKLGKRKVFVALSSYGVAVATLLLAWTQSWYVVIAAAVVLGLSWGVYQSIDQALINQVLPAARDKARDMGILNLAVGLPNTLAPVLAALLVTTVGGYATLYVVAAALTIAGGILIRFVRSVS